MKTLWTVIIVIVVLAVVGYGGYRIYHHYTWKPPAAAPVAMQTHPMMKVSPSAMEMKNNIYKMMTDAKLGSIVTDDKGMTLYTFSKDTSGVSSCNGACAKLWPPYTAPSQTGTFPTNVSAIKRTDGTFQYAWKGMPLYYYAKDTKAGDTNGNGFGGLWSVVK